MRIKRIATALEAFPNPIPLARNVYEFWQRDQLSRVGSGFSMEKREGMKKKNIVLNQSRLIIRADAIRYARYSWKIRAVAFIAIRRKNSKDGSSVGFSCSSSLAPSPPAAATPCFHRDTRERVIPVSPRTTNGTRDRCDVSLMLLVGTIISEHVPIRE